jgi:hypothetical protein
MSPRRTATGGASRAGARYPVASSSRAVLDASEGGGDCRLASLAVAHKSDEALAEVK